MMTAGHSYIICRRQLRTQPGLEAVEEWSGANGVACKPTPALHLRREVFQVEHFQLVTDLDAPAREAAPEMEKQPIGGARIVAKITKSGNRPAALAAGLGLHGTRSCYGDAS